ncbi:MAG: hypothetical protein K9G40_07995 [Crocinitomicaceae bacterium]|nr:hypothetical protein [Crocinitomicaceae bacterium]
MGEKVHSKVEDRLLEARQESLQNHADAVLRPLGKLWGMDVFSWSNPFLGELANTIHSFPFQVIWIGSADEVKKTLGMDNSLCSNLNAVIVHNASIFGLEREWICNIKNCAGVVSVQEAMEMLKAFKESKKVLLFTSSGEDALANRQDFETYVKMVQGA